MPICRAFEQFMTGEDPTRAIELLRRRITVAADLTDAPDYPDDPDSVRGAGEMSHEDAEALLRMSDEIRILGPSEVGDYSHEKYLRRCIIMAERCGGLSDALDSESGMKRLLAWINTEQTGSAETNRDYRVALRQFGKHATGSSEVPEPLARVPAGYPSNYDRMPDPGEMLHWEEHVLPMIDTASNYRDAALVALAWDLGPRAGELFDLTVGSITDAEHGLRVALEGKRGKRAPLIVPAIPYVRQWLNVHPGEHGDPLWSKLSEPEGISNNRVRDVLKTRARKADVSRPVTPTNFRKSSASYLASQGVSQAHLESHHGWTRGSDEAARYIAVFGDANDREVARAHGVDVSIDEPDPTAPLECPRCEKQTPREGDECVWCGCALSAKATEEVSERKGDAIASAAQGGPELAEAIMTIEETLGVDVVPRED